MLKSPPHLRLEISLNESSGDPVAAYLQVRSGNVAETREVHEGVAFADYDADGAFLGIELLAPCPVDVLDQLMQGESEPIRRFVRGVAPQQFLERLIRI